MCFFLTIGVPADNASRLEDAIPRGLAVHPVANPSILRMLPAGYRTFVLTSGSCSCDLYRAPTPAIGATEDHAAKLRRKYARRGWSEAKIQRALAQAAVRPEPEEPFVGLRPDVRQLLARLVEEIGELALVNHWYNGDVETEEFEVVQGLKLDAAELQEGNACGSLDTIIFVKR
jgi:hypothetical protein